MLSTFINNVAKICKFVTGKWPKMALASAQSYSKSFIVLLPGVESFIKNSYCGFLNASPLRKALKFTTHLNVANKCVCKKKVCQNVFNDILYGPAFLMTNLSIGKQKEKKLYILSLSIAHLFLLLSSISFVTCSPNSQHPSAQWPLASLTFSHRQSLFSPTLAVTSDEPHSSTARQKLQNHHHQHHHHHQRKNGQHAIAAHRQGIANGATTNAPEFAEEMLNLTVPLGRDVVFECVVNNLGSYKLAWLKLDSVDSKITEAELISIQTQIVLNNSNSQQQSQKELRYRVSSNNYRQWFLYIKQIKSSDRGYYMCQINTEPIISQAAFLDILIAPSIDYNATSADLSIDERHRMSIRCRAKGYPPPTITWRREDNKDINLGLYGGKRYSANKVEGEFLNISQVTRDDMGAYLCIASNSVPPSVSKRIIVRVNFRPKIKVSNQLVGSMMGSDVQLECRCEASPVPTTSWIRSDGKILTPSAKYQMREEHDFYKTKMKLKIFALDEKDFGAYKCVAKNEIGEKEGLVRLYEIAPPASTTKTRDVFWPTHIYPFEEKNNLSQKILNYNYFDNQQQASTSISQRCNHSPFIMMFLWICFTSIWKIWK